MAFSGPACARARDDIRDLPGDRNMWNEDPDSCAGVTAYCSFYPVGYDISCDSNQILLVLWFGVNVRALVALGEG